MLDPRTICISPSTNSYHREHRQESAHGDCGIVGKSGTVRSKSVLKEPGPESVTASARGCRGNDAKIELQCKREVEAHDTRHFGVKFESTFSSRCSAQVKCTLWVNIGSNRLRSLI